MFSSKHKWSLESRLPYLDSLRSFTVRCSWFAPQIWHRGSMKKTSPHKTAEAAEKFPELDQGEKNQCERKHRPSLTISVRKPLWFYRPLLGLGDGHLLVAVLSNSNGYVATSFFSDRGGWNIAIGGVGTTPKTTSTLSFGRFWSSRSPAGLELSHPFIFNYFTFNSTSGTRKMPHW